MGVELNKQIGQRIRTRRKELGLSQTELAEKLGYKNRSSINKIENEGRKIQTEKIVEFANALDISVDYIMGWDKEVHIVVDNKDTYDEFQKRIIKYFNGLTTKNKKIAENYLKFLLENQNKK